MAKVIGYDPVDLGYGGMVNYSGADNNKVLDDVKDGNYPSITVSDYQLADLWFDWDAADLSDSYADGAAIPTATTVPLTANDNSSLTMNTTATGMTFRAADGGAVEFTATGGIRATETAEASYTTLNDATDISIVQWFNTDNTVSRRALCSRYPSQFNNFLDSGGGFLGDSQSAIGGAFTAGANDGFYAGSEWVMMAFTYAVSDGIARWYANGVEVKTDNWGTDGGDGLQSSPAGVGVRFSIGTRSDDYSPQRFDGKIAVCRLYTASLAASEILSQFNNTKARFGVV